MPYGSLVLDQIETSGNLQVTGNVATSGSLTATNFSSASVSGLRNRFINGDMAIDQRQAGASQTITAGAALAYTIDRWYAYCTGANVTGQRVVASGNNRYEYRFTGASGATGIGFGQRIEALEASDLVDRVVTLSVMLSNTLLATVNWTAYYANTVDTFGSLSVPTRTSFASGTFTVNSTLTRYSTQISIPAAAHTGIEIVFTVGAQTSGIWAITEAKLELGTVATPFERPNHADELTKCYRYFVNYNSTTNSYQPVMFGTLYNTTTGTWLLYLPTKMRVIPSLTRTGAMYFLHASTPLVSSFAGPYSQIANLLEGDFSLSSSGTTGATGLIRWNNIANASRSFTLSAEL